MVDDISLYEAVLTKVPDAEATFYCSDDGLPLSVSLDALSIRKNDRSFWAYPDNIVFGEAGLNVTFPARTRPERMAVSLESNDRYLVETYIEDPDDRAGRQGRSSRIHGVPARK